MKNTLQLVRAPVIILHLLTIPFSINYLFWGRALTHAHTHSLTHSHARDIPAGGLETKEVAKLYMALSVFSLHLSLNVCSLWEQHLTEVKDTCKYMGQRTEVSFWFSISAKQCKAVHVTAVARLLCGLLAWVGANVYSTSACSQRLSFTYCALECVCMGMRVGGLPRRFTSTWVACFVGMLL